MSSETKPTAGNWQLPFNELALLGAILVVVVATSILDTGHSYFHNPGASATDIARNTAMLGIFALGAAVVIIAGGIDLSAGSTIALSGTVCACIMLVLAPNEMRSFKPVGGWVVCCGVAGAMLTGLIVGTFHSWLVTAVRLPPFIATLATLVGLRSIARALCEFTTAAVTPSKQSLININDPFFKAIREDVRIPVLTFVILAFFTWIILSWTVLGRHLYALGGNENAARLSGIRTDNVKWVAYCFASLTAAIAGIFYIANESVAAPVNQGRGHELNAIAAAVVGGCSLQGGVGTVAGTVLGALFLRVVIDAVAKIIKTGADVFEGMIVGLVVVLAVTFSQIRQVWSGGRSFFAGPLGWAAIPTLALITGVVGTINTAPRIGIKPGIVTGIVMGGALLIGLVVVKLAENSRTSRKPKSTAATE